MIIRFLLFIFLFINSTSIFAEDIPVIVISAGKSVQSKSIVGSDVSIVNEKTISNSNESFVGDLLSENLMGMNYFQSGGYGTVSGIQLRGQPKRYSTVYLNGIKLSDPSTPSNDYYFGNLMNGSLDSVEVLKGSQSTLYGSGAIAGTINLYTKKGRVGHHQTGSISESSSNGIGTTNMNLNFDGKVNNFDYFFGATNFGTEGMSARTDDLEKDRYRNDNFVANVGYQFSDLIRVETYVNYTDTFLEYDSVSPSATDDNSSDDQQTLFSTKLIIDNGNLTNTIGLNKTYFLREDVTGYDQASPVEKNYEGSRDSINLVGQYNLNLDTRIVYGLEYEVDAAEIPSNYHTGTGSSWSAAKYVAAEEEINSQYIDLQFRPLEKLYSTIGFRRDEHSIAGAYNTGRITAAYKLYKNTKLRSSYGTGLRFPSLNEYYFGSTVYDRSILVAEESTSYDFGIDQVIPQSNMNLSINFFRIDYENYIGGWKTNIDSGNTYVQKNTAAKNFSKGTELLTNWKPNDDLKVNFGYALTRSYDGSTCSNPDDTCNGERNVRIPEHSLNSSVTKNFNNRQAVTIQYKYVGTRRDYGGSDNGFKQVFLKKYSLLNFYADYKLDNDYIFNISVKNATNQKYNETFNYSVPLKSFNVKLTKKF